MRRFFCKRCLHIKGDISVNTYAGENLDLVERQSRFPLQLLHQCVDGLGSSGDVESVGRAGLPVGDVQRGGHLGRQIVVPEHHGVVPIVHFGGRATGRQRVAQPPEVAIGPLGSAVENAQWPAFMGRESSSSRFCAPLSTAWLWFAYASSPWVENGVNRASNGGLAKEAPAALSKLIHSQFLIGTSTVLACSCHD